MEEQIIVEGIVSGVIFHNEENGYTVFSVEPESSGAKELVCVGFLPVVNEGESIKITGSFVMHPTYGKQLNIQTYEKTIPKTEKSIERYLASGVIKGIGPKLAAKITEKFGADTLNIMESEPEKLSSIRGISVSKAMSIGAIFHEQAELRRAMLLLQDYGISPVYAMKIYKRFKDNTVKIVETNPYMLADEIFGIGFKISDSIAEKAGIEKDSPFRINAGIKYVLNHEASNGNVYLPLEELFKKSSSLLGVDPDIIKNCVTKLNISKQVWLENDKNGNVNAFLNSYYYAESYVAKKLLELSFSAPSNNDSYLKEIKETENETGIKLAHNQKLAVEEAMKNGVLVITGGPGTGKTTTINTIIKLLKNEGYEIELAAPTGRAAKRMSETTGIEAQTIHRLLGISYISDDSKKQTFDKNEDNPIEADVIIIDESSMVDILLMHSLLKAVPCGARLILVGDVDQLPSVGPGNVLKDIINSGCIKVVKLNEIFRQAGESAIGINRGEYPVLNEKEKDFFFMKRYSADAVCSTILELVTKRLPKFLNCSGLKDIQILTPMRKSPLGVINLNTLLQKNLNPPCRNKEEKEFRNNVLREGDKVMQIKNNYDMTWRIFDNHRRLTEEGVGIFNGDEGIITRIDNENEYCEVVFDECKYVKYDFTQLDELELSYAVTIHKSQGSEYKAVIIPVYSGPEMLLNRNLLYTAVTRAKELAVLVGIPETLYKMIDNNKEINRYTYLKTRISDMHEVMIL